MARIILASIVGATLVFAWGALSHMVLPIGDMGVRTLPNEPVMLGHVSRNVTERGAYLFPGLPDAEGMTDAQMDEAMTRWQKAYEAGPRGMLIYDPTGDAPMSPRMLVTEFLGGLGAAFIASLLCARLFVGYALRVLAVAGLGIFAWLSIDLSYWNWYRFPDEMALAGLIDQGVGWSLAGLAIGAIIGPGRRLKAEAPGSTKYPTMISRAQEPTGSRR